MRSRVQGPRLGSESEDGFAERLDVLPLVIAAQGHHRIADVLLDSYRKKATSIV